MNLPQPREILGAILGFSILGATAATWGGADAWRVGAAGLAAAAGAVALTTPTVVIAHAFIGLDGPPSEAAAAPLGAFTRAGRLAGWLAPVLLFFVAAGGTRDVVYGLALVGTGLVGLAAGAAVLASGGQPGRRGIVAFVWVGLAGAVGLHLLSKVLG